MVNALDGFVGMEIQGSTENGRLQLEQGRTDNNRMMMIYYWTIRQRKFGILFLVVVTLFALTAAVWGTAASTMHRDGLTEGQKRTTPYDHTHDLSFPGMNDSDTKVTCAAPILVELERSYSLQIPPRFSTLMIVDDETDDNRPGCSNGLMGVESWDGGCSVSPDVWKEDMTVRDYVDNCIPDMNTFKFWLDDCPASLSLLWNERTCEQTMANSGSSVETIGYVPMLNGAVTAIVRSPILDGHDATNNVVRTILVPDPVSPTCWTVSCGWSGKVSIGECIEHATNQLRHVSLDYYAKFVWGAECD